MMSPAEIAWRLRSAGQNVADRIRIPLGLVPDFRNGLLSGDGGSNAGFRTTTVVPGAWVRDLASPLVSRWSARLRSRADAIAENRLGFFNLENVFVGDPVDWHRDHEFGRSAPRRLSQTIDYRDFRVTGDAKNVWEPNRHHHLVVLGRAFRAFGEGRYAEAVHRHIASWIERNPFGYGMNWRSPLELGIRMINWTWALDLVREHRGEPSGFRGRVLETVWRHLREITRKYSRGSSANNHLVGEAAGVFVGSAYFTELPEAQAWLEESHDILSREISRQTYADGCTREQALGYHFFVLQLFLAAGIVGRMTGRNFPPQYWDRMERMIRFAGDLAEGGPPTMFGDCDDGIVLDLAGGGTNVSELLSIGAALFGCSNLKVLSGEFGEAAYWMLGCGAKERFDAVPTTDAPRRLGSRAYPESGLYLLQSGGLRGEDRVSVLFDCAELGYTSIAAHGHADALAFTYRVSGKEVFVDPGTFDYFSYPEWRAYFRSTAAHNTVEIDGENQSEMLGPFLWGARAEAKCTRFETAGEGGIVSGEHDGYTRLPVPARHSRTIEMNAGTGAVTVTDDIRTDGAHDVRIFFHVAEGCTVHADAESRIRIEAGPSDVFLDVDPALTVKLLFGSEAPIGGWVSRGYHKKIAGTTIILQARTHGNCRFRCGIVRTKKGAET